MSDVLFCQLAGFVEGANPHDMVMVACPLPPAEEWAAEMHSFQLVKATCHTYHITMFMLTGFVEDANLHDVLMVACPLPPAGEWGEEMHARAALLAAQDLTPQLFLPRPEPTDR